MIAMQTSNNNNSCKTNCKCVIGKRKKKYLYHIKSHIYSNKKQDLSQRRIVSLNDCSKKLCTKKLIKRMSQ